MIQKDEVAKKIDKVPFQDMLFIDSVQYHRDDRSSGVTCEWKYSFGLQTKDRKYFLFSRTEEEQFLWLTSFYRMAGIQVVDMRYEPTQEVSKMYQHSTSGFHYRVRDPDTSSREAMEVSSARYRERQAEKKQQRDSSLGKMSAQDSGSAIPFDESKRSENERESVAKEQADKLTSNQK